MSSKIKNKINDISKGIKECDENFKDILDDLKENGLNEFSPQEQKDALSNIDDIENSGTRLSEAKESAESIKDTMNSNKNANKSQLSNAMEKPANKSSQSMRQGSSSKHRPKLSNDDISDM